MTKHIIPADCRQCSARLDSVFEVLSEENLNRITANKICGIYAKGQIVYTEGTYASGIFCIKQGTIKEYRTNQNGQEKILHLSKTGDILGYEAMLTNTCYGVTAEALEETKLCFISSATFHEMLEAEGNLCASMMKMMSHELLHTKEKIAELALKSVRERVAQTLLELRETYGSKEDNSILELPLTREGLAQIVGAAPENVIRMLSEFKRDNLITMSYHHIKLMNIPKLQLLAEGQY